MYSLAFDSLDSDIEDGHLISFVLSRLGQSLAQETVKAKDLPEILDKKFSSLGVKPQDIDRLAIVDSEEGHFWSKIWGQRKRVRWVESLGLRQTPQRISPQRALASQAFFQSGFSRAGILCVHLTPPQSGIELWAADQAGLHARWPSSYGESAQHFFERLAEFCGFYGERGQSQFMELSGYGEPRFVDLFKEEWLELGTEGQLLLKNSHWDFSREFHSPQRSPDQPVTSREIDIYSSLEAIVKEWALELKAQLKAQPNAQSNAQSNAQPNDRPNAQPNALLKNEIKPLDGSELLCVVGEGLLYQILKSILPQLIPQQNLFFLSGSFSQLRASGASALLWPQKQTKPQDIEDTKHILPASQLA